MNEKLQKLIEKNGAGYCNGKIGKERVSMRVNSVLEVAGKTVVGVSLNGNGYRGTGYFFDGENIYDSKHDIEHNRPIVEKGLAGFLQMIDACLH